MNYSDLIYFQELAQVLNMSRAAERIGITQPSLSLAIQRLETEIGIALFHRSRKGVTLTQGGKELVVHARRLIDTWDGIKKKTLASENEVRGNFTLGCHPSVALSFLGNFLPKLITQHPSLRLTLVHDLSRKITEGVIAGNIDVGIVVNPVHHLDLVLHKLADDVVTLWHRRQIKAIDPAELENEVLLCDTNLLQTQDLLSKLKRRKWYFARTITSSSLEIVGDLAASGAGYAILPSGVVRKHHQGKLLPVPKAPIFKDEIFLLFRAENKGVCSIQAISQAIRSSFGR